MKPYYAFQVLKCYLQSKNRVTVIIRENKIEWNSVEWDKVTGHVMLCSVENDKT